jgi:hypothetical protein
MRELTLSEVQRVAGGLEGTKIPFFNGFIGGENMRGKPAGAIGAAIAGWAIGQYIGAQINQFNERHFGMSLGVAIHRTVNGGSRIGGGTKLIPVIWIEEV